MPLPETSAKPARRARYTLQSYRPEASLVTLLGRGFLGSLDAIDQALKPMNISAQQFALLHALQRGTATTPSELARLRYQSATAITYTLGLLEGRGLLERRVNEQDRRVIDLLLTPSGDQLTRACLPLVVATQNELMGDLNETEYQTLVELLQRISRKGARQRSAA